VKLAANIHHVNCWKDSEGYGVKGQGYRNVSRRRHTGRRLDVEDHRYLLWLRWAFPEHHNFMLLPTVGGGGIVFFSCPSVRPLTPVSRDAMSSYLVDKS